MHITPTRASNRLSAWLAEPRIWQTICLWAGIACAGVYVAHALITGM